MVDAHLLLLFMFKTAGHHVQSKSLPAAFSQPFAGLILHSQRQIQGTDIVLVESTEEAIRSNMHRYTSKHHLQLLQELLACVVAGCLLALIQDIHHTPLTVTAGAAHSLDLSRG